jgi:methylenetetrahydrofolate dehydrogenase (NADP+)/methenyltetrahydrofolate cyclohydrolase
MQRLLNGKELAEIIKAEIRTEVEGRVLRGEKVPHLAAILVGNNPASEAYIKNKIKSCEQVGFKSSLIRRDSNITEAALLAEVEQLNQNADVDGFIVQLPLPKHINESAITLAIQPQKDVDGFHPLNFGLMAQGLPAHLPATPFGILQLLKRNNIPTAGKNCVIVGRSNIVGTPLSILLSRKGWDCTVTLAHSRTQNLAEVCRQADILVAAIGIPRFIKGDIVKAGAVVIDVGINRVKDPTHPKGSRLVGDVDYEAIAPHASYITPVPGGVGPMTVTSLIFNTLQACKAK